MLAAENARVIASYTHDQGRARELGDTVRVVLADITLAEDRERLLDEAKSLYGLVVFTGVAARAAKDWDESLAVNYTGADSALSRGKLRRG